MIACGNCGQAKANVIASAADDVDDDFAWQLTDRSRAQQLEVTLPVKTDRVVPSGQPPRRAPGVDNRGDHLIRQQTIHIAVGVAIDRNRADIRCQTIRIRPGVRQSKQPLALPGIQTREDFIRSTKGNSSLKSDAAWRLVANRALGMVPMVEQIQLKNAAVASRLRRNCCVLLLRCLRTYFIFNSKKLDAGGVELSGAVLAL